MEWTKDKPSEPGWYWFAGFNDSVPEIVQLYDNGDGLYVVGCGLVDGLWGDERWSERLEPPK